MTLWSVVQVTEIQARERMEDFPVFPDPPAITVERTLAIIKPDAIKYADSIIEEIKANGFTILQVWTQSKCLMASVGETSVANYFPLLQEPGPWP